MYSSSRASPSVRIREIDVDSEVKRNTRRLQEISDEMTRRSGRSSPGWPPLSVINDYHPETHRYASSARSYTPYSLPRTPTIVHTAPATSPVPNGSPGKMEMVEYDPAASSLTQQLRLYRENKDLTDTVVDLKNEQDRLVSMLDSLQHQQKLTMESQGSCEESLKQVQQELATVQEQYEKAKQEASTASEHLRATESSMATTSQILSDVKQERDALMEELLGTRAQLAEQTDLATQHAGHLRELAARANNLATTKESLEAQLASQTAATEEAEKKCRIMQQQLDSLKREVDAKVVSVGSEQLAMQQTTTSLQVQLSEALAQATKFKEELSQTKAELQAAQQTIHMLHAESNHVRDENKRLQDDRNSTHERCKQLKSKVQNLKESSLARCATLEEKFSSTALDADMMRKRADQAEKELETIRTAYKKLIFEHEQVKAKAEENAKARTTLSSTSEELYSLQLQLKHEQEDNRMLKAQLATKTQYIETLTADKERDATLLRQLEEAQKELATSRHKSSEANEAHAAKLQQILQQLDIMNAEHAEEMAEKDETIVSLRMESDQLSASLERADQRCTQLEDELKVAQQKVKELEKAKKHLDKKVHSLQAAHQEDVSTLRRSLTEASLKEHSKLQQQLSEVAQTRQQLDMALRRASAVSIGSPTSRRASMRDVRSSFVPPSP